MIVYPHAKEAASRVLIEQIVGAMTPNELVRSPYPDTRKVVARLALREADPDYMNAVITSINGPGTSVARAGLWDKLHQYLDDLLTRTILCKSGFTPDLTILLHLDPKIQFRMVQQGLLRIFSQLTTEVLLEKMREVNTASGRLDRTYSRGERNPFQAIFDSNGITWVGNPSSSPPRREAWSGRAPPRAFLAPASEHRVVITGPALNWTDVMIRTVLSSGSEKRPWSVPSGPP
jgi:hypothetical protein